MSRVVRGVRLLGVLVGCAWLPACAPGASAPGGLDATGVGAEHGSLVQLEVAYTRERALAARTPDASGAPDTRLEAEAHFIRYRAADPTVDRTMVASLLGLGDDDSIALDACRVDDRADELERSSAAQGAGAVEVALLDAGPLELRMQGVAALADTIVLGQLEPQRYPELFPFVSGVVYGQETSPAPALQPGATLQIEASGGEDVGPFLATGAIPAAFPGLRATREGALRLAWDAIGDADVLIDVRWGGARPGALRCRARDDGGFSIAPALLAGVDAALAEGEHAQASVSRSERAAVEAPGAGAGQLVVTLRDTVPLDAAGRP